MPDDIPSLTLRVLEKIRAELVTLRSDMNTMRGDMNAGFAGVRAELDLLNTRFDHFLAFVGKDVQDLKTRVTALEQAGRP
jgi:hypothetical protein